MNKCNCPHCTEGGCRCCSPERVRGFVSRADYFELSLSADTKTTEPSSDVQEGK